MWREIADRQAFVSCLNLDFGGAETEEKDLTCVLYVEDEHFGITTLSCQPPIVEKSGGHSLLIHMEGLLCQMLDTLPVIPEGASSKWGWLYRKWTMPTGFFDQCTELFVRRKRSGLDRINIILSRDERDGGRSLEVQASNGGDM